MARVELRVFGSMQVVHDGVATPVAGRVQQRLLGILLRRAGHPVPIDTIIDLLWRGQPPATAIGALRVNVNRLRRLLEPQRSARSGASILVTEAGSYLLNVDDDAVDTRRFARLVGGAHDAVADDPAAALAMLVAARELWRGRPWQTVDDEPWVRPEVERLEELRRAADETWADAQLALGRHVAIIDRLRVAAETEPLRERRWEQLMVALHRSGRQSEALRAFDQARSVLGEETGLEPGPSLRQTYDSILRAPNVDLVQRSPPGRAPRARFALDGELIGREGLLGTARGAMERSRLVTLTGMGGVGKTAAAVALAEEMASQFADGVSFVDLDSATELAVIVRLVRASLGMGDVAAHAVEPLDGGLHVFLRDRRMLLVLDNCEGAVAHVAHLVEALLASTSGVRVLATSRMVLGVGGESVIDVPPLAVPDGAATPDEIRASAAVRLFGARSGAAIDALGPGALGQVVGICRRTKGLPLAIELAANAARSLAIGDVLEMLAHRDGAPVDLTRGSRQTSLHATLAWSYDLLAEQDQVVLRRLGVFPDGFTIDGAARVAALGRQGSAPVAGSIARLVGASLVRADALRPGRYGMLEPVREFALQTLDRDRERADAERRLVEHLLSLSACLHRDERTSPPPRCLARLDQEQDTTRATLDQLLATGRGEQALAIAATFGIYWNQRGQWGEGHYWLTRSLQHTSGEPTIVRARALISLALCASTFTAIAQHADELAEAADITRHSPEATLADRFRAEVLLALATGWLGNRDESADCLHAAASLADQLGSPWAHTIVRAFIGLGRALDGDPSAACAAAVEAADSMLDLGDSAMAGRFLMYAGALSRIMGEPVEARRHLERSAVLCEAAQITGTAAHVQLTLAQLEQELGDPAAGEALLRCRHQFVEVGDTRCAAVAELGLAAIALDATRGDEAHAWLAQCLPVLALTDHKALAIGLADAARVFAAMGRPDDAATLLGAAEALAQGPGTLLAVHELDHVRAATDAVDAALGARAARLARRRGRDMPIDAAVALAVSARPQTPS